MATTLAHLTETRDQYRSDPYALTSQRNDILSPADLQYEPQDGQPGTVVLGKSSDLRLNLVGSAVHT